VDIVDVVLGACWNELAAAVADLTLQPADARRDHDNGDSNDYDHWQNGQHGVE